MSRIEKAEDRELFKELCQEIGEPCLPPTLRTAMEEALDSRHARSAIRWSLRPAFTLGGTGGGFADNEEELRADRRKRAAACRRCMQVLVEKVHQGL